jgi:hypothetical protein
MGAIGAKAALPVTKKRLQALRNMRIAAKTAMACLQFDKKGVTGSSPVPPIHALSGLQRKVLQERG